jgi:hypothetical protein
MAKIAPARILQYLRGDHEWKPLQTQGSRLRKGVEPFHKKMNP